MGSEMIYCNYLLQLLTQPVNPKLQIYHNVDIRFKLAAISVQRRGIMSSILEGNITPTCRLVFVFSILSSISIKPGKRPVKFNVNRPRSVWCHFDWQFDKRDELQNESRVTHLFSFWSTALHASNWRHLIDRCPQQVFETGARIGTWTAADQRISTCQSKWHQTERGCFLQAFPGLSYK